MVGNPEPEVSRLPGTRFPHEDPETGKSRLRARFKSQLRGYLGVIPGFLALRFGLGIRLLGAGLGGCWSCSYGS